MTRQIKQMLMGVTALAALALGGAAVAGAAGTATTTTGTTTAPSGRSGPPPGFTSADAPGTAAHEDAEKAVTGADAEKAIAAALATVSGGKAGAVTTTFRGDGYEVDVTRSDGTKTTVYLDSSFKVQTMGQGGPRGGHPPFGAGGPGNGQPPTRGASVSQASGTSAQ